MNKVNFIKMNGAGNDFILISQSENPEFYPNVNLVRELCNRRKGIGADGLLLIKENKDFDFELEYYNCDGSLGSLCGNGARCSIKFAFDFLNLNANQTEFLCNNSVYKGEKTDFDNIKFHFNKINLLKTNQKLVLGENEIKFHFVENGSPHAVIFWNDIYNLCEENFDNFDIQYLGKCIRFNDYFNPGGANVNFIHIENNNYKIRTYERGVEEETFACGTGTVASAIIMNLIYGINSPISIKTKDNDILTVDFVKKNENFEKINLTGPAKINYIGTYNFQK